MLCGKLDDKVKVVGLVFRLVGCLVPFDFTAFGTAVDYDITLFGIGDTADGLHGCTAFVCPVPRVHIHVKRPKTDGTMVAGCVSQRLDFCPAVGTNKAVIVF